MGKYAGYACFNKEILLSGVGAPHEAIVPTPFTEWNIWGQVAYKNCYAFACDAYAPNLNNIFFRQNEENNEQQTVRHSLYVPGPGATGGRPFASMSPEALRAAIITDGFIYVPEKDPKNIVIPAHHYLIAGYCYTHNHEADFHFYRFFEPEEKWYHKARWFAPVTDKDFSNKPIRDLQKAERYQYQNFIGFFLSPPTRPNMNIVIENDQGKIIYGDYPRQAPLNYDPH